MGKFELVSLWPEQWLLNSVLKEKDLQEKAGASNLKSFGQYAQSSVKPFLEHCQIKLTHESLGPTECLVNTWKLIFFARKNQEKSAQETSQESEG